MTCRNILAPLLPFHYPDALLIELNMDFSQSFELWLETVLASDVPSTVVAFSFNLFELDSPDAKYGIELIGADEFDEDDPDWACAEVWAGTPRSIPIPRTFEGGNWEDCLRKTSRLIKGQLAKSSGAGAKLKEADAVAIGFVDGDLELIWER